MPKSDSTWSVTTKQDGTLIRMVAVKITATEPTLRKRFGDFMRRWGVSGLVMVFAALFGFAGMWALVTLSSSAYVGSNESWLLVGIVPLSLVGIMFCLVALIELAPSTKPRDLTARSLEVHRAHSRAGLQWFYPETIDASRRYASRLTHNPVPEPFNTELAVMFRESGRT